MTRSLASLQANPFKHRILLSERVSNSTGLSQEDVKMLKSRPRVQFIATVLVRSLMCSFWSQVFFDIGIESWSRLVSLEGMCWLPELTATLTIDESLHGFQGKGFWNEVRVGNSWETKDKLLGSPHISMANLMRGYFETPGASTKLCARSEKNNACTDVRCYISHSRNILATSRLLPCVTCTASSPLDFICAYPCGILLRGVMYGTL